MSIANQIQRLQNAKAALAVSIANKGVEVPSATKLDGYAALVDQIQQGGGSGDTVIIYGGQAEDKGISFIDCDGSVIASYTTDEIANLESLPAAPAAKTGLQFVGWSKTLEEVKADPYGDWICARYTLAESNTLYAIVVTPEDNCTFAFSGLQSWGASQTSYNIDWGDGSSDVSSTTKSHVFASAGTYMVKASCTAGEKFRAENSLVTGKSSQYLLAAYLPANMDFNAGSSYYTNPTTDQCVGAVFNTRPDGYVIVDDNNNSEDIRVGEFANCRIFWLYTENMTRVSGAGAFSGSSMRAISSITNPNSKMFYNCKDIKKVKVRASGSGHIGERAFHNTASLNYFSSKDVVSGSGTANDDYGFSAISQDSLKEVWFSSTTSGFPANMFENRNGVSVYFPKTTPPTLSSTVNLGGVIIYVPNSALSAYEAADNWSVLYANNQIIGYSF